MTQNNKNIPKDYLKEILYLFIMGYCAHEEKNSMCNNAKSVTSVFIPNRKKKKKKNRRLCTHCLSPAILSLFCHRICCIRWSKGGWTCLSSPTPEKWPAPPYSTQTSSSSHLKRTQKSTVCYTQTQVTSKHLKSCQWHFTPTPSNQTPCSKPYRSQLQLTIYHLILNTILKQQTYYIYTSLEVLSNSFP